MDEATLSEFLTQTYPRLVPAVALVSGSRASAEDAVLEALARAWEHSNRGEEIESLPAWVTRVALNLSKNRLRRLRRERERGRGTWDVYEDDNGVVAQWDVNGTRTGDGDAPPPGYVVDGVALSADRVLLDVVNKPLDTPTFHHYVAAANTGC